MERRLFLASLAAAAVASSIGCSTRDDSGAVVEVKADIARAQPTSVGGAPAGISAMGTALLASILGEQTINVMISPVSIALAMAMLRQGVQGASADQIDTLLSATSLDHASLDQLNENYNTLTQTLAHRSGEVEVRGEKQNLALELADAAWCQTGLSFEQPFLERLARWYGAGVQTVDFRSQPRQAAATINSWCDKATHERIATIVPEEGVDTDTRLVLANALYFKAPWAVPLEDASPAEQSFTTGDGSRVEVPMMACTTHSYAHGPGWEATRLDYAGDHLAMALVLPDQGVTPDELLQRWGATGLAELLGGFERGGVTVTVPKWTASWGDSLKPMLKALGVTAPFDSTTTDLAPMTTQESLFVSDVVHKTWIAVDEKGTEAAAVTAVMVAASSAELIDHALMINRPFLYVVYDLDTATVLFLGVLNDPSVQ